MQFSLDLAKSGKAREQAQDGPFKKAGVPVKRYLREFRTDEVAGMEIGQEFKADVFETGDMVDVTGISKGRGFKGVIARHGQHRGPMTHGSRYHRRPGSMGACSYPGKVFKGKGLPGHTGVEKVTIQNLRSPWSTPRRICPGEGAVPGAKGQMITIKKKCKSINCEVKGGSFTCLT